MSPCALEKLKLPTFHSRTFIYKFIYKYSANPEAKDTLKVIVLPQNTLYYHDIEPKRITCNSAIGTGVFGRHFADLILIISGFKSCLCFSLIIGLSIAKPKYASLSLGEFSSHRLAI